MSGGFSKFFRTGSEANTTLEIILKDLNASVGNAYDTSEGSNVYIENFAYARALDEMYETAQRARNCFDPDRMPDFMLSRWEKIFDITPPLGASHNQRRQALKARHVLFNVVPTEQAVRDYIRFYIPDMFIDIETTSNNDALVGVPGGATVPGGITAPDAEWQSSSSFLGIRTYQPINMSDTEFYDRVNSYADFLGKFLPAYVTFDWFRYTNDPDGTVSVAADSDQLIGTGTQFITDDAIESGDEIEVFDDSGAIQSLVAYSVDSETAITLLGPVASAVTNKEYRLHGFALDTLNLDNAAFDI